MAQKESLLSVIVPVYNAEKYIEECVESILQQSYQALDIILVDDGSSDGSGILCDSLAKKDSRIRILHIEHGGITNARLAGVWAAKGERITFVDADDWIAKDAYEGLMALKDYDVIVTGICRYVDSEHQVMQMPYFKEGTYDKDKIANEIVPIMLWNPEQGTWALDPSLCTKLFKRKVILEQLKEASKVGSDYGEDSVVTFPMMFQVDRVWISKKIYYYHRQRKCGEVASYIRSEEFFPGLYRVYEYLKAQFKKATCWEIMRRQLECFLIDSVEKKKCCYEYPRYKSAKYFPINKIPRESKVILYGAGNFGKEYWKQNSVYQFCNIISWVDSKCWGRQEGDSMIEKPEVIKRLDFDYILVAVDNYRVAKEIALCLKKSGVMQEKIVWHGIKEDSRGVDDMFLASSFTESRL